MATTIFVPPFTDPQLKQFAQQVVAAVMGSAATVTVGQGNPTNKGANGDTYWNAADNNFWIYDNNIWNQLDTGVNESLFFGKQVYFIPPKIDGTWDTTKITLVLLTVITATGTVFANFNITTDVNGNITIASPTVEGLTVNILSEGTPTASIVVTYKNIRAAVDIKAGQDLRLYSSNMAYDYRYLALRYADDITGGGISVLPDGKRYLGIDNNPNAGGTFNPTDYTWYDLGSPLSSSNRLWLKTGENRIALFRVASSQPDGALYNDIFTSAVTNIDLDSRTGSLIQSTYDAGGTDRTVASTQNESATFKLPAAGPGSQNRLLTSFASISVDDQGRIANFGSLDKLYVGFQVYVVTAAQVTTPTFAFNHVLGQALIFLNGILLDTSEYTETTTSVTIPNVRLNDSLRLWRFTKSDPTGVLQQTPFTRNTITTVAGQTAYTIPFTQGSDLLWYNGVFMNDPIYEYTSVNNFQFKTTASAVPTFTGGKLTMVSFNLLSGVSPSFSQFVATTRPPEGSSVIPLVYTVEGTVGQPQYTFLAQNGVAMTLADYTTTTTTASVAGTLTLSARPLYDNNFLEGTSWQATGVATLASGVGATTTRTLSKGMLLANGEKVKEVGEEDPSKNGLFTQVELPKSIGEMFYELQEQVAALEAELRQMKQGGNNGSGV